jgi:hypothetical protein
MLVTRYGKKHPPDAQGMLLLSFSKDGLVWDDWEVVRGDGHVHDYPSLVGAGDDPEPTGREFWIYYRHTAGAPAPQGYGWHRWDRVPVTLR